MSPWTSVARDRLGVCPLYFREDGSAAAGTIAALLRHDPAWPVRPDREGLRRWLCGAPDDRSTCVAGIGLVPAGHRLVLGDGGPRLIPPPPLPEPRGDLGDALVEAVAAIVAGPRKLALALSGGLDSALVLAIVRRELGRTIPVVTLAVEVPGYGELEATRRTARALDVELHEIHVGATDFLDALPQAVRTVEVPLWNPHPVSKLLLARALRREGFDAVLTGDAADQVLAGASGRDYLPLVGRLFHAEGIEPCSPFFDLGVLAHAAGRPADPDKTALRRAAARWLPHAATRAHKRPRLFPELGPDLGVERLVPPDAMRRLAARLGLPSPRLDQPDREGARSRCAHATLCLLWPALAGAGGRADGEADPCAASSE